MQLSVIKQEIGIDENINKWSLEQNIDSDITLPDYCPDVMKILKCSLEPKISVVNTSAGRATAEGNADLRLLYLSPDGLLNCFEQSYPFSKYIELKDDSDITVNAEAKEDYINCRAVSSRRLDIHACVSVIFKAYKLKNEEVITGVEEDFLQTKKCEVEAVSVQGFTQKSFSMSETAVVADDKPSVKSIINSSACTVISDIKVINNKLLIKGELITDIIYCCEGEDSEINTFEHSMPISQIIEINGIQEDNKCSVKLKVNSLNIQIKSDSSGENKLIDISAVVSAQVTARSEKKLSVAVDAYSTLGDVKLERKSMSFYLNEESIDETFLCRSQLDLSSLGAQKILAFWCSDITKSCSLNNLNFKIDGTFTAHFIYKDSDDNTGFTERTVDFSFEKELKDNIESFKAEPNLQLCGSTASCTSQGIVDIKAEIKIDCDVYSQRTMNIISSVEPLEGSEDTKIRSSLVIYFADSGETLWDIARRYKTSVEAIQRENSLNEEAMEEKRMLLIPRA